MIFCSARTFIIAISLTRLSPKPDMAPSLPATDCDTHRAARAPSQLNTNATRKAQMKTASVPSCRSCSEAVLGNSRAKSG